MKKHLLLDFNDEKLLRRALTHSSYVNENPGSDRDNERLEFLGDAILNFLSGEYLYNLNPEMGEDEMTRRRSALVDEISVNIRVMCSTSKNLKDEISNGNFREDLFHRINVIPIETPYLKDIKEDIPYLIEYFVKRISDSNGLKPIIINSKNTVFYDYNWPGNVRELRNLIERVVILASGKNDDVDKILSESLKISSVKEINNDDAFQFPLKEAREKFEKNYLEIQLNRHNGNVSKTADYIGMERSALHRKLKSLGIN